MISEVRNPTIRGLLSGALLLAGFFKAAWATPQVDPRSESMAIEHVTVLPMTEGATPLRDMTVVIHQGRIAAITASTDARIAPGTKRIDGRGKWLMPGLTDMHVHVENARMLRLLLKRPDVPTNAVRSEDVFMPYVANGVVQVLDLQAMSETIGQRIEIETGRILGPRIVAAAMIDGGQPSWPIGMTRVATTPEDGRQAVRDAAAEGYDAIKLYGGLDLDTFRAIVAEARRLKMPTIGHLPARRSGQTEKFFQPGFGMVAHAEEFAQRTAVPSIAAIPQYVEMMKLNGSWLTATLTLDERLLEATMQPDTLRARPEIRVVHPMWREVVVNHNPYVAAATPQRSEFLRQVVEFNRELVRAFIAAGIPVVAGTDAQVPGIVPGFSMHDELAALARAGMTNLQALEAATRLPCEWLGVASQRGTVEAGKQADLLLLDADPLDDLGNSKRIAAVILGGRYLSRAFLDQRMRALAAL
jgi:imidazolonepropionase-like amidohydrolase